MKKFKVEIALGNDAMNSGRDIAQALISVVDMLEDVYPDDNENVSGKIFDINGNKVGDYRIV